MRRKLGRRVLLAPPSRCTLRAHAIIRGLSLTAALGLAGLCAAYSASFIVSSDSLAATTATVPHCSTAGIGVAENVVSGQIVSVTLTRLDTACEGGTLSLTVNTGGGSTASGSGAVPASGTMTVTTSPSLAFVNNAEIDTVITGP